MGDRASRPAQFTTTSTPPNSCSAWSNTVATALSSATSACTQIARPPEAVITATVSSAAAASWA